jgi:hypothetical protein
MIRPGTAVGKENKKTVRDAGPGVGVSVGKKAEVKRPELEQFLEIVITKGRLRSSTLRRRRGWTEPSSTSGSPTATGTAASFAKRLKCTRR